jgi:hypothetical protein
MDLPVDNPSMAAPARESWQHTPGQLSPVRSGWLLLRRVGSLALVVLLLGVMLSLLLSLKRYVPVVAVFGSGYESPWGPIPMTHEDRLLLEGLSHSSASIFEPRVVSWQDASGNLATDSPQEFVTALVSEVASQRPGGPAKNVIIAYLSMVGTIDTEGVACLVPPRISETETIRGSERLVSVARLLTELRSAVDSQVHLVVVLDACHGNLSWPLGLVEGGFPVAVQATLNKLRLSRTWVVVPAAAGETSQGDPADGHSAFARFFAGGLEGAADRHVGGDGNGVVDLRELLTYLRTEVRRYTVSRYGVRQTPQVMPAVPQTDPPQLTWARKAVVPARLEAALPEPPDEAAESPTAAAAETDWWLRDRWQVAESIRGTASHQRPRLWQQYQRLLLRAEMLRNAGVASQQQQGQVEVLAERLEIELTSMDVADTQYLASLRLQPLASAMRPQSRSNDLMDWTDALKRAVLDTQQKQPPLQADDTYVTVDLWNRRADAAWEWLTGRIEAGGRVDAGMLQRWLEKLGSTGGALQAEPTQIHAVRMLLRELDPQVWQQAPDLPGKLLRLIGRSREACFPADVRADRLIALLAPRAAADRALRAAIDHALVGDPSSLREAERLLAEIESSQGRTLEIGRQASAAYRSSDDLFDEFPWLVAWLVREQRVAAISGGEAASERVQQAAREIDWQATIDTVARFQRLVAEIPRVALQRLAEEDVEQQRIAEEVLQRLSQSQQDAEAAVAPLRDALSAAVSELTTSSPDTAETLGRLSRILDTPLVRGDPRLRLLQRADRLRQMLRQVVFTESDTLLEPEPVSSEAIMASWTTWHDIAVNPLLPVLTTTISGISTRPLQVGEIAASLGRQLAAVRAEIGRIPQTMVEVEQAATRVENEIPTIPLGPQRDAKRVESLIVTTSGDPSWRRLAGILNQAGMTAPSPVRKSLLAAWHDRLITAATDALDDFWAGAQPQSPVWCLAAARGFLEKAEEVIREARIEHGTLYRRALRVRLTQLEESSGLAFGEGDYGVLQLDPRVIRLYDSRVLQDSPPNVAVLTPELGVPAGLATLQFTETDSGKPLPLAIGSEGSPVLRLPLPTGSQRIPGEIRWQVSPSAVELFGGAYGSHRDAEQVIDAIASFRGHRLVTAAPLAMGSAIRVIEWQRAAPQSPRVIVRGEIPRNRAVAIVFDCSGSMGERLPDGRTRLEAGREALYEVLETIARDGGWSVSLWLYGHRTRWTRNDRGEFEATLTDAGKVAEKQVLAAGGTFRLVPGDDVEQVMQLQPLVPIQVAHIRSIVDAVEPGGETPLYLAIREAIQADFGGGNPGPSHVLVVTDGANDQSGGQITTSSDVQRTLSLLNFRRKQQDEVRIDVIGFDLQPGVYDRQIRLQDLQSVAADSRGRFFDATDAQGLTAALRTSLEVQRWRVRAGGDQEPAEAQLNQTVVLPTPIFGSVQTYDVALESPGGGQPRRVSVAGGETIELFVTGQGRGLEFRRYDGGTEQGLRDAAVDLPDPVSPDRRWFLGAHLAHRSGAAVRFPLSVQNGTADGFSPRPVEMWVDLQPMGPAGPVGLPYVFTDLSFQPGRPVPVVDLVARDWPAAATTAEIRGWLRFEEAVAEVSVPVASLAPGVERTLELSSFPESKVTARVAPLTSASELVLTVIEEHPRDLADKLPTLKVAVPRGCTKAVHIVVPDTGRVRHEFTVEMIDEQVASDVMLTVTDRRAIQRDAVGPTSPGAPPPTLRVAIPPP